MKIFRYITRNTTKQIPCFGIAITDRLLFVLMIFVKMVFLKNINYRYNLKSFTK